MVDCVAPPTGHGYCGNASISIELEEDNCAFICSPGCILSGNITSEACENTGSGNEALPYCVPLNCTDLNVVLGASSAIVVPSLCGLQYQSQCIVSCDEGFTGNDITYLCNVTSDPTMVDWIPLGGVDVMCERGLLNIYIQLTCLRYKHTY